MSEHTPHTIEYPGRTSEMAEEPHDEMRAYRGNELLKGKRALVTGGDSGIGRAVAVAFAKEGADVAIAYLEESDDAAHTAELVEGEGRRCRTFVGDLADPQHCRDVVARTVAELGELDIVVNNVAYQEPVDDFLDLSDEQWRRTFSVNIDSYFHVTKAAVPHLGRDSSIINTGSVNGLRGNKSLIDYSATKGAVMALTYSLAQTLLERGIRVNCVAPGPVWTPLIPATMDEEKVAEFGKQAPYGRAAQPPTRSRRPTCSSLPVCCRPTTPGRCSLRWVVRLCRVDGVQHRCVQKRSFARRGSGESAPEWSERCSSRGDIGMRWM